MRTWRDPGRGLLGARWTAIAFSVSAAVVAFAAALTRQRGVPRFRTLWAEDGHVFGQCALTDSSPLHCLATPYEGYFHTVPRLSAWLATSLPPEWLSYVVTGVAAAVLAACAFLVARAVAAATGSNVAGGTAGASLALVYPAGAEVAGNLANLHWILFLASAVVLLSGLIGGRLHATDKALVLLTIASSAFGLILVLLVGASWVAAGGWRGREWPRLLIAAGAVALIQVAAEMVAPRSPSPLPPVGLLTPIDWFVNLVYMKGPFGGRGLVPGWLVGVTSTIAFGALVWQRYRDRASMTSADTSDTWWRPPAALAFLGISGAAVFGASAFLNAHVAPRYEYVPAGGLVIFLVVAAAILGRGLPAARSMLGGRVPLGAVPTIAVALIVAVGAASTFRVSTGASDGPSYPATLRDASVACAAGADVATVRISPLSAGGKPSIWEVAIPCARIRD